MSDAVLIAIVAAVAGLPIGVASVISAVRSTQAAKETKTNGGSSMRDEIKAIVDDVKIIAVAVLSAETHAQEASAAAGRAEAKAQLATEGMARADAFHLYMHDRVHDLANGLMGNRGQIVQLREEIGLVPWVPLPKADDPILPDRLYPPAGDAAPNPFTVVSGRFPGRTV